MHAQRVPRHIPVRLPIPAIASAGLRLSAVPSKRIAPSGGHLRRSGGQSTQGAHQPRQRLPECGPASLVRRLADVSQIVAGIPIVVAGSAVLVSAAATTASVDGPGADAGSGLLQDTATMLLAGAIDAPSGRGDTAATTAAIAVPMMLPLLLEELLLQLHIAQSSIHHPD